MTEDSEARYRLPRDVVPSRYDLVIDTDLDTGRFHGSVDVAVSIVAPVSEVVLNAVELELSNGSVTTGDGRSLEVTVRYLSLEGRMVTENRAELPARVVQHEIDHLDGILFFQRLSPAEKTKVARRLKELEELYRSRTPARR